MMKKTRFLFERKKEKRTINRMLERERERERRCDRNVKKEKDRTGENRRWNERGNGRRYGTAVYCISTLWGRYYSSELSTQILNTPLSHSLSITDTPSFFLSLSGYRTHSRTLARTQNTNLFIQSFDTLLWDHLYLPTLFILFSF